MIKYVLTDVQKGGYVKKVIVIVNQDGRVNLAKLKHAYQIVMEMEYVLMESVNVEKDGKMKTVIEEKYYMENVLI